MRVRDLDASIKFYTEGLGFVGLTICYAYMQSVGMVNDHLTRCFRWQEIVDDNGK